MKKPKSVDTFIEERAEWKDILGELREIVISTGLNESIKWQMPCYTDRGKNIASIYATKDFVGLWFFQGALLTDEHKLLSNAQEGKTKAMRRMMFTDKSQLDQNIITEYLYEAIENQRAGRVIKADKPKSKPIVIPEELADAFVKSTELREAFEILTYGKKREFTEHIGEAKRADTRLKRLEKCIPMILAGISLNDKYRKK